MVHLIHYDRQINIGDQLSPIVANWIQEKMGIQDRSTKEVNLLALGSILAADFFCDDAVVWGSGIHYVEDSGRLVATAKNRRLDVRAVRGPYTRRALEHAGYLCPHIYGDPAVLMPLVYEPNKRSTKNDKVLLIRKLEYLDMPVPKSVELLSVKTRDYKEFIDKIVEAKLVISSSLHGLVLAESYGVPAVWLMEKKSEEVIKFFDWYYSTDRESAVCADSIEQALEIKPMKLPDLAQMQRKLLLSFPKDCYEPNYMQKSLEFVLFGCGKCFSENCEIVKKIVDVRRVCDNDESKWGTLYAGIECVPPEELIEQRNAYVIVMTENNDIYKQISIQLENMGIYYYELWGQWKRHTVF